MSDHHSNEIDVVKELRLRRWARLNYIPPEGRNSGWSPIILDEMERKDAEMQIQDENRRPMTAYVPLVPPRSSMIHDAHAASTTKPHVSKARATQTEDAEYLVP